MQSKRKRLELSYVLAPASGELTFSDPGLFKDLELETPEDTTSYRSLIFKGDHKKYDDFLKQIVGSNSTHAVRYKIALPSGEKILVQDRGGLVEHPLSLRFAPRLVLLTSQRARLCFDNSRPVRLARFLSPDKTPADSASISSTFCTLPQRRPRCVQQTRHHQKQHPAE